jgi:hypothetical protein
MKQQRLDPHFKFSFRTSTSNRKWHLNPKTADFTQAKIRKRVPKRLHETSLPLQHLQIFHSDQNEAAGHTFRSGCGAINFSNIDFETVNLKYRTNF